MSPLPAGARMHLLVIHYHWRPGGVRQVVESALPALVADSSLGLRGVFLAAGHPPPSDWARRLQASVGPHVRLGWETDPLLAYAPEWPVAVPDARPRLTAAIARMLQRLPEPRVVLLENPAVGRHPTLGRAVADACVATGARLVCHHHDFFVDGRWERWPETRACGIASVAEALANSIPGGPGVTHLTVSARDAAWLARCRPTSFCPNPVVAPRFPTAREVAQARTWIAETLGTTAPVWLCPTRVLRRKNLVEAALVARLLDPEAVVVATGGVSSPSEARYAAALAQEDRAPGTTGGVVHAGLLSSAEAAQRKAPRLAALMTASDRVVVCSLFEGFGLPVMEAAALAVPTLARRDACPDGQELPGVTRYDDLRVFWDLAGGAAERSRQQAAWTRWRDLVPPEAADRTPEPPWWSTDTVVPFSRLTLHGQLDVWRACKHPDHARAVRALNPGWAAATVDASPETAIALEMDAASAIRPITLATALAQALAPSPSTVPASSENLAALLDDRLAWANLYPLLWPGGDVPAGSHP